MRRLIVLLALLVAPSAHAAELEPVGQFPGYAAELEVAGNLAFLVDDGAVIVDIANPREPKQLAHIECSTTADVALDPAVQILVLAVDGGNGCVDGGSGGIAVYDIRDPAKPDKLSEVPMPAGAHTVTMDGRTLYANQPDETGEVRQLEIFDLSDPAKPRSLPTVEFPVHGPHESFLQRRPDGRALLYTANSLGGAGTASVLDVTDPSKAKILQSIHDPAINYSHQAEVSFDNQVILLADELLIGSSFGACGQVAPADGAEHGGGLHLYAAAPDGTYAQNGLEKVGRWNPPVAVSGAENCTIHNFMQSPNSRRLLVTWYSRGTYLVDFTDPANVTELASSTPAGGRARAAIAHNGLIYTADYDRGMDVFRFKGEGWPSNSGPAEAHRFGPPVGQKPAAAAPALVAAPAMPAPATPAGRASLRVKLRRAARLDLFDSRGVRQATLRLRRGVNRVRIVGHPGRYRWKAGKARGRFTIRRAQPGLTLPAGQVLRASR